MRPCRVREAAYPGAVPVHDFTLPADDGSTFSFHAEYRAEKNALLFFYRGHW